MKRFIFTLILLFALIINAQNALWEKKGITGGIIQDLFKDKNLGLYYISTDSGIYKSQFLTDWFPMTGGLYEFSPIDSAWVPLDGATSFYVVLTVDGVFAKRSSWNNFIYANKNGLVDSSGIFLDYQNAKKVGIYKEGTNFYVYLSLEGSGLFKRQFNPYVDPDTQNPWESQWSLDVSYIFNPYISAMSSLDGGSILLVANKNVGVFQGNIYRKTSTGWEGVGQIGMNYTSLSKDPSFGNYKVLAGVSNDSYTTHYVQISIDGQNFSNVCGESDGPWESLSITTSNNLPYGLGSVGNKVYFINPNDCDNPFTSYSYFVGDSNSVFLDENLIAYIGTRGMGLWEYPEPDQKGNPLGVTGANPVKFNNVSDLVLVKSQSRTDIPPIILASSEAEGFYKCFRPDYCTRYFYIPSTGDVKTVRASSLAVVPGYDEYGEVRYSGNESIIGIKTIYLGTRDFGLFRSDDGGASWKKINSFPLDNTTGKDYEIAKVVLAPDFNPTSASNNDKHIFVLTRGGLIFKSIDGGTNWVLEVDLNLATLKIVPEDLVVSPSYNSFDSQSQILFAATSSGIFKRTWLTDHFEWQLLGLDNYHIKKIALSPCFGFANCPECPPGDPECEKEKSTIIAGTMGSGLFYSFDSGQNFYQLTGSNCPNLNSMVSSISMHPKTDIPNPQNRLLHYVTSHSFDPNGNSTSKFAYIFQNSTPEWECVNADLNNSIDTLRINKVAYHPDFGLGNDHYKIVLGHDFKGMYKNDHPPINNWVNLNGFYNVPERINSIAECPSPVGANNPHKLVFAGTEHYGVMVSFDSGESYFPFSLRFEYKDSQNRFFTLHNAESVSCTEVFDPCTPPESCPKHRILTSGSDCAQFDENLNCINKNYYGIYWSEFIPQSISTWEPSTIDGNPMDGHFITEIRYCSNTLPIYAADFGVGNLYSNFNEPDGWGKVWHLDNSGDYPVDITDITCPDGQSGPTLRFSASSPDIRPARPGFIWGAQSGGGGGLRTGTGTAKFKTSPSGSWQSCTGLSATANWRAVIMLESQNVLIGSFGTDTTLSDGIYRNSQDGSTCNAWEEANMGFSSGDSPQITQNYSRKIAGFAKVSNGVLVAMQQGGLGNREGGVFFSDTDSDGLAWVPVNSGMSCTSNYEIYNGQYIYTGSTCNGVYQTDVIQYTGYPTAYFTYEKSSNPWYEERVTFYDRSAGLPTSRQWDFDNDSNIDATPSSRTYTYDFLSTGYNSYNTKVISCQNSYCDTYELDDNGRDPVEIVNTLIPKVEKDGNYIKIYWNRITSGGHNYVYNIYSSSSPQGTSAALLVSINDGTSGSNYDCITSLCWYRFTEGSSEKYYKIKTTW